ncbi:hypothetical protein B0H11DRAFT_2223313 [Mycena galericulata]|nr:hypothetical protein B0H11DRAFT_2223313 [Mycena galericulata]
MVIAELYDTGKFCVAVYHCVAAHTPTQQMRKGIDCISKTSVILNEGILPDKDYHGFLTANKGLQQKYHELESQIIGRDVKENIIRDRAKQLKASYKRAKSAIQLNRAARELHQAVKASSDDARSSLNHAESERTLAARRAKKAATAQDEPTDTVGPLPTLRTKAGRASQAARRRPSRSSILTRGIVDDADEKQEEANVSDESDDDSASFYTAMNDHQV